MMDKYMMIAMATLTAAIGVHGRSLPDIQNDAIDVTVSAELIDVDVPTDIEDIDDRITISVKRLKTLNDEIRLLRREILLDLKLKTEKENAARSRFSQVVNRIIKREAKTSQDPTASRIRQKRDSENVEVPSLSVASARKRRSDTTNKDPDLKDILARNNNLEKAVEKHLEYFLADLLMLFQYDIKHLPRGTESRVETRRPRSRPKRDLRRILHNVHVRKVLKKYFHKKGRKDHEKAQLRFG